MGIGISRAREGSIALLCESDRGITRYLWRLIPSGRDLKSSAVAPTPLDDPTRET
jgi:hypothetical protein